MDKVKKPNTPEHYVPSSQRSRIYMIFSVPWAYKSRFASLKSTPTTMAFAKSQKNIFFNICILFKHTFHFCVSNVFKHWIKVSRPLKHIHRHNQQLYAHFPGNYCILNLIWIGRVINVLWQVVVGVGVCLCLCEYHFKCDNTRIVLYMSFQIQNWTCLFFHLAVSVFVYNFRAPCFVCYKYSHAIKYRLSEDRRIGVH
jgi:hypothetical protein